MLPKLKKPVVHFGPRRDARRSGQARLALAMIVVFIFLYWLGSGCYDNFFDTSAKKYFNSVREIVNTANEQTSGFRALLNPIGDRNNIIATMKQLETKSRMTKKSAEELRPPKALKNANHALVFALKLREKAFDRYEQSILNALANNDQEVAVSQIMAVWQDLSLADRAYAEWRAEALSVANEHNELTANIAGPSRIVDPAIIDRSFIRAYINKLKQTSALHAQHGIAVIEVATLPQAQLSNPESKLYTVDSKGRIKAKITVENQGNQIESNIIVKVRLESESEPVEQIDQQVIEKIKPGEKKAMTFENIATTQEGLLYLLTVTAGPVVGELDLGNNSAELKFVAL